VTERSPVKRVRLASRRRGRQLGLELCLVRALCRNASVATVGALRRSASRKPNLARRLATRAHTPPDAAALAGLADRLDKILANESPEQAKELLRLLIKEIRVHNRRRIVPTYRVPSTVRAVRSKVEPAGLEPATSCMPCTRSPN
jgi:hypothetical protein